MHTFITSRLDCRNALLSGLLKNTQSQLQFIQRARITRILKSLHWLPVIFSIAFKMLLLVCKAPHGLAPDYLRDAFGL